MSNDEHSSDLPETISLCDQSDGKTYALLIGVDIYLNTDSLWNCTNDVDLFNKCLVDNVGVDGRKIRCLSFDPKLFNRPLSDIVKSNDEKNSPRDIDASLLLYSTDGRLSLRDIIEKIGNECPLHHIVDDTLDEFLFNEELTEKDKLIIMFSGHGFEVDGVSYLAPTDLMITKHSEYKTKTAISLKDLKARLDRCPARLKWLIINACRVSVEGAECDSSHVSGTDELSPPKGTVILQSCRSKEISMADNGQGCSPFIQTLVNALSGEADFDEDGMITMKDVVERVKNVTQDDSADYQVPCYTSDFKDLNQIIVIRNKTEGMTPEEVKKGQDLFSKAKVIFNVAKEQEPSVAIILLKQAYKCDQEALQLIPEQIRENPKRGKYCSEWMKLKEDIQKLMADINTNGIEEQKGEVSPIPIRKINEEVLQYNEKDSVSDKQISPAEQEIQENRPPRTENLTEQMPLFIDQLIEEGMLPNAKIIQSGEHNIQQTKEQRIQPNEKDIQSDERNIQQEKGQRIPSLDDHNMRLAKEQKESSLDEHEMRQTNESETNIKNRENRINSAPSSPLDDGFTKKWKR